jgi:hypothetical protein
LSPFLQLSDLLLTALHDFWEQKSITVITLKSDGFLINKIAYLNKNNEKT